MDSANLVTLLAPTGAFKEDPRALKIWHLVPVGIKYRQYFITVSRVSAPTGLEGEGRFQAGLPDVSWYNLPKPEKFTK
jgi:hypothetical protein